MFHRWNMRHGGPAFAGGAPGPEAYWAARRAEQEQAPQGWRDWQGDGGHGHGHGGHGGHGPWQGGPPWMRHGGLGFAPPWAWAPWAMRRGFGGGPGGPRAFGRGDLKYSLLGLLSERPKHGYEMIKELEAQAGGFYTPSAGAVYPSLQLMEDRGWITSQTADGKKVYSITDAGRTALREREDQGEEFGAPWARGGWGGRHGHHGGPFGHEARPEVEALRAEGVEVARLLVTAVMRSGGDPAKLTRVREIITGTRRQLEDLLRGAPGAPDAAQTATPDAPTQKLGADVKPDEYL
jgi:DNA-binding PadR family transcriptional regulator